MFNIINLNGRTSLVKETIEEFPCFISISHIRPKSHLNKLLNNIRYSKFNGRLTLFSTAFTIFEIWHNILHCYHDRPWISSIQYLFIADSSLKGGWNRHWTYDQEDFGQTLDASIQILLWNSIIYSGHYILLVNKFNPISYCHIHIKLIWHWISQFQWKVCFW